MKLTALPAFCDNCIRLLHDAHHAVVVDPGDATPVLAVLKTQGLTLIAILVTHHHPDHVGGLAALRPLLQGKVCGPARETISGPIMSLNGGDRISVPGLAFDVIDVPGHSAVQQGAADRSGPAVLGALREWKNNFR